MTTTWEQPPEPGTEEGLEERFIEIDDPSDEMNPALLTDEEEPEEDQFSQAFINDLIDKIMAFLVALVGHDLHIYQKPLARRIIESVLINDGAEVTALAARQSGKSETVADVVATLMVLLPRLAKIYPDLLGKFADGVWVGLFAPVQAQAETLFGRAVSRLTSPRAIEILADEEIDDLTGRTPGITKGIMLKNCGSTMLMMTANPRAKIESKSFHIIILDEAQDCDDFIVNKSIMPMGAYYNATKVKTGTPTGTKNNFYRSIQLNRRLQTQRGKRQLHFQWDWKDVSKVNLNYAKFIRSEKLRIGEDSDEFLMSYCPVPETKILTADLRHVPAGDIVVGDRLVGFDEERTGKGLHRRLKESVVEAVGRLTLPCYKITLSDGTEVTCSSDHQWLVSTAGRRTVWKRTEDLTTYDRIFKVTDLWEHTEDYRTGYLAAAFEGEGHFCRGNILGFSQRENAMYDKVMVYLDELGFTTNKVHGSGTNHDVTVSMIAGGRTEIMRFLGQVRPQRLLDKLTLDGFSLGRQGRDEPFLHPRVTALEFVGDREVCAIKTSTKTYIAEGLASHNCCRWLLERGMFVTSATMDELGDTSQEVVRQWGRTPVVVGVDPARKMDSTVVTVVWVDWDRPDEYGYYDHRVLNWLEIQGDDWEEQYFQIVNFLKDYNVLAVGVDSGGVGDAVAQRLELLMPHASVIPVSSSPSEQSKRWKHLQALIQRKMIGWPAHAKAMALDTPIITPRGWRTIGSIQVGEQVFGPDGQYTQVVDKSEVFQKPCFRVTINDGESFVVSEDHLWTVCTSHHTGLDKNGRDRSVWETLTTREMFDRGGPFRLPKHRALVTGHEPDYILDPYLLGCWLGDGSTSSAEITSMDPEIVAAFAAFSPHPLKKTRENKATRYTTTGLQPLLTELGLLGRKVVPEGYLLGSYDQRLALLQGLMDTDGTVGGQANSPQASFSNTNLNLAEGVWYLASSLGLRPTLLREKNYMGPVYRVVFQTYGVPVFRLPRKLAKVNPPWKSVRENGRRHRSITAIEPVAQVPTQCIAVDNPSHLFLVGKSLVPTHNTRRLRIYKRFYQQMCDLEKNFIGPNMMAAAPDEAHAHDDFADSLAIACAMTQDLVMPQAEMSTSPFFSGRGSS